MPVSQRRPVFIVVGLSALAVVGYIIYARNLAGPTPCQAVAAGASLEELTRSLSKHYASTGLMIDGSHALIEHTKEGGYGCIIDVKDGHVVAATFSGGTGLPKSDTAPPPNKSLERTRER